MLLLFKCSAGHGIKTFIDKIVESEEKKVAIVGPICSTATEPVTELANYWNLAVVSPHIVCIKTMHIVKPHSTLRTSDIVNLIKH